MNILAIESSCDETAAAIISGDPSSLLANSNSQITSNSQIVSGANSDQDNHQNSHPQILSNVVVSQIDIFKAYGGVIPEVAARSHLEAVLPVIHQAFEDAGFTKPAISQNSSAKTSAGQNSTDKTLTDDWSKIDAIAVTHTPGLLGSLLIGTLTARTLAILHQKPLYAIHHLKSHIYANWLQPENTPKSSSPSSSSSVKIAGQPLPTFPLLALVISGGHTQIIRMSAHNDFEIIGTTLDDAVGECFDKVAKILGLPYPGGPSIANAATPGNPEKYPLPIPNIKELDFSFSGLKTAVLRAVQKEVGVPISYPSHQLATLLTDQQKADFAASFEQTAVKILLKKLKKALSKYPDTKSIVIAGGVSANQRLRTEAAKFGAYFPDLKFSGDNAAMVGTAALYEIASDTEPTDPYSLNIYPRSSIK